MGRSDTGIHFDPVDSPEGSAGCIVLRNKAAWGLFEQRMTAYQSGGVEQIPLLVFYSD
jgi:hypothetical protein